VLTIRCCGGAGASAYVILSLNRFGERGGFDAIVKRCGTCNPAQLRIFMRILRAVRLLFVPGFGKEFVEKLIPVVFSRLLSLADGTAADPKQPKSSAQEVPTKVQLDSILTDIEELIAHCIAPAESYKLCEEFRLRLALRLLNSPILERQVLGMTLVADLVDKLKPGAKPAQPLRWIDQKFMSKWVVDNKVCGALPTHTTQGSNCRV
jgi:hypothetical protein